MKAERYMSNKQKAKVISSLVEDFRKWASHEFDRKAVNLSDFIMGFIHSIFSVCRDIKWADELKEFLTETIHYAYEQKIQFIKEKNDGN